MRLNFTLGLSPSRVCSWLFCGAALLAGIRLDAAEATAPVVPAFERFHGTGQDPDAGGRLLLGELNCTSCHTAEKLALQAIAPKQAPILDVVGTRVRPDYFRSFLASPQTVKPGTTMPDPFPGWDAAEKAAAVEALTHFLATTGMPAEQRIPAGSISKGEELFHRVGCVACHNSQKPKAAQLPTSVPLGQLASKYSLPGLMQFISNPHAVRPSGRMPSLNLQGEEARDIAAYLLRDLKDLQLPASLKFAYYEGEWSELPDFAKLTPKQTGDAGAFDVSIAPRKDNFALRFTGQLQLPKAGEYTFTLASDDGSRIFIDDKLVASHDGIHPPSPKSGKANLTAGKHAVVVEYFEAGGGEELTVEIQGQGLPKQPLENLLIVEKKPNANDKPAFVIDAALAEKGKQLFTSVGCASCHSMKYGGINLASTLQSPALAKLPVSGGCLSPTPSKGKPFYSLDDAQRKALAAGMESLKKAAGELKTPEKIAQAMLTFNCYACHKRGEIGGVEPTRDDFFLTTQKEMGDEGRLPPPLTGVGAKLQADYLKQFFEQSPKERPYMHTRMPKFGSPLVTDLHKEFELADKTPEPVEIKHQFTTPQLKQAGRMLVGSKGFSCIKCHTWGKIQATGIQSINMQRMTTRLKPEWFEAYILNPQAFRPGTRMPAAWPEGQVLLPKVLDGQAATQIRSLWAFLSDGEKAPIPLGLGRDPIELTATTEAIMYRNFIEGAGARAIGVGYPEKVNLAFDANQMRLAMIWQGSFIDASRHWTDRGTGYQGPLGDNIVMLPTGAPLAVLETDSTPWPDQAAKESGFKFRGYHLDELRRPTFLYSFHDLEISDEPLPVIEQGQPLLRRKLTFKSAKPIEHLYFRAAASDSITTGAGGVFTIDKLLTMKLGGSTAQPIVRDSKNKRELLVPIILTDGKATLVQEFAW